MQMWIRLGRSGDADPATALEAAEESARELSTKLDRILGEPSATPPEPSSRDVASLVAAAVARLSESPGAPSVLVVPLDRETRARGGRAQAGRAPAEAALAADIVHGVVALGAAVCPRGASLVIRLEVGASSAYVEARARRGEKEGKIITSVSLPLVPRSRRQAPARARGIPK